MSENTPSCESRIDAELASRIEDLTRLWELYQEDADASDDDLGNMYEYGLAFDYVAPYTFTDQAEPYFRYQLSWGGPSDEFRFYASQTSRGWVPYRIEYRFMDWFDGATRELRGSDRALLVEIFDWFDSMGSMQAEYDKAMDGWEPTYDDDEDENFDWENEMDAHFDNTDDEDEDTEPEPDECPEYDKELQGVIDRGYSFMPGYGPGEVDAFHRVICPYCNGTGQQRDNRRCTNCEGGKWVNTWDVSLRIPHKVYGW